MRYRAARRNDRPGLRVGLEALHGAAARGGAAEAPRSVHAALGRSGVPLEPQVRAEFETRMGADFSGVRVHTDEAAAHSARDVGALAYTVGSRIAFGAGRFAPGTSEGKKLLRHELTHVVQQRGAAPSGTLPINNSGEVQARDAESAPAPRPGVAPLSLQRAPDPKAVADFDKRVAAIRKLPEFTGLDALSKTRFDEIVAFSRARDDVTDLITKLELVFSTAVTPAADMTAKNSAALATAARDERARVAASDKQDRNIALREEAVSNRRARKFLPAKGQDGTIFALDASDPTDIAVRAQVHLTAKGGGTADDLKNVKALEDAIEKRASTLGYSLDLAFVDRSGPNVFEIGVDTSKWTFSDNWQDNAVGLVHELHHALGLSEDRYDYKTHADNKDMTIAERIEWFREEFTKQVSNNPESIMDSGENLPLDDDICRVAGKTAPADLTTCVKARSDARAAKLKPGIDLANSWLTKSGAAPAATRDALAKSVFTTVPTAQRQTDVLAMVTGSIDATRILLVSQFAADCASGMAFAADGFSHPLRLCPTFLAATAALQARALLVAALQLAQVGTQADADCPAGSRCGISTCGDATSSKAWARFIECSAGGSP